MERKCLAFVLSGGASRGALQVGALRALLEAGIQPDLLVGTSAGAINATFLAVHGFSPDSLDLLTLAWRDAAVADLLPINYLWLMVHTLFYRTAGVSYQRMREFLIGHGLSPDLRFGDIRPVRLILVAADLNSARYVLYGQEPDALVLEGVLCSAALPPWVPPMAKDRQLLMDGGAISNLPVEPALAMGATEIIALDLLDSRDALMQGNGFLPFIVKVMTMAQHRQAELELALAEARGVRVHHIALQGQSPVPIWNFTYWEDLVAQGYDLAREQIARWPESRRSIPG